MTSTTDKRHSVLITLLAALVISINLFLAATPAGAASPVLMLALLAAGGYLVVRRHQNGSESLLV